ncbi:MAG TPA: AAA family ATPase [Syntrophorhabdaceae bacterium]|nr:AAA family ATPase [Syntrophorhabdaceae bacterium]
MKDGRNERTIDVNPEFRRALHIMENTTQHAFITGKAGTGKSTLLDHFRRTTAKEVAVLAPTGVAALNIEGHTIHSFFNFKPNVTPEKIKKVSGADGHLYRQFDTIIIDEISMVRADLIDCIEKFLRLNGPSRGACFGGIQMVFIGDLYQLPPVVTAGEREIFSHRYESPYFFSAQVFTEPGFDMEFIELEKVYRQTDPDFIALLNAIRNRTCTGQDIERLNERCLPDYTAPDDRFSITLTSTNDLAVQENFEKLNELPGQIMEFGGALTGAFDKSSLPAEESLKLKVGAQIMLVNNDKFGRWVNGSLGMVLGIGEDEEEDRAVLVELEHGGTVPVIPHTWEIFEYLYDRSTKRIATRKAGSFTQYPIRLAWAVTIHKSQGKTFDSVIIDTGRGAFAHGQVYVALSRCVSFEGIVLKRTITKAQIRMDWRVVRFLTSLKYRKAEEAAGVDEKRSIIEDAIRRGMDLEVTYLKPDDTKSTRTVRPIALEKMHYKGKAFEGLRAYCRLRMSERTFRIERILELSYSTGDFA